MPGVNPGDAASTLKLLLETWALAAEQMLLTVAKYVALGVDVPDWAARKHSETVVLRDELTTIMAGLDRATPGQAVAALDEAYRIGERAVSTTPLLSRPQSVQTLAVRLVTHLRGAHLPVIAAHMDLYRSTVTKVELDMQTGTIGRRDAIARTVDRLLAEGKDRFVDARGRRWHLDTYARMAGRTIAGQAAVQGQLDTMVAEGRDLVIVSDSPRECGVCRPWEGRLLSIGGRSLGMVVDGRRVEFTVAQAIAAGLHHPNCTHRLDPFTSGLTRKPPVEADPEGYEAQQVLRRLERRVRDLKRRRGAAETVGDDGLVRDLNAAVREQQRRLREHIGRHGLLRHRDREQPYGG